MDRDAQGDPGQTVRLLAAEGDAPGERGRTAVAATGGEAAEPSHRLTKRDRRSRDVRDLPSRKPAADDEDEAGDHRCDEPAVENPRRLESAQERARVVEVVAEVESIEQHLGADDPADERRDPEIEHGVGGEPGAAGLFLSEPERQEKGDREHQAVGGKGESPPQDGKLEQEGSHDASRSATALPPPSARGAKKPSARRIVTPTQMPESARLKAGQWWVPTYASRKSITCPSLNRSTRLPAAPPRISPSAALDHARPAGSRQPYQAMRATATTGMALKRILRVALPASLRIPKIPPVFVTSVRSKNPGIIGEATPGTSILE